MICRVVCLVFPTLAILIVNKDAAIFLNYAYSLTN